MQGVKPPVDPHTKHLRQAPAPRESRENSGKWLTYDGGLQRPRISAHQLARGNLIVYKLCAACEHTEAGSCLRWQVTCPEPIQLSNVAEATGASASLFCKHCHNIHCLLLLLLLLDFNQLLHQYPPVCSACTLRRKQRLYYFHMLLPFHAWAD